jgi:hypothetical protein
VAEVISGRDVGPCASWAKCGVLIADGKDDMNATVKDVMTTHVVAVTKEA